MLDESLNEIEAGWEDGTDGNLIVYLDKSPYLTQFSSPVLLKIRHDETDRIVSEVIKYYPEQDSGDPEVVRRVLSEVIELFPAKTHGLAFAAHGNGWIPGNARELINGDTGNHEHKRVTWPVPNVTVRVWKSTNWPGYYPSSMSLSSSMPA